MELQKSSPIYMDRIHIVSLQSSPKSHAYDEYICLDVLYLEPEASYGKYILIAIASQNLNNKP